MLPISAAFSTDQVPDLALTAPATVHAPNAPLVGPIGRPLTAMEAHSRWQQSVRVPAGHFPSSYSASSATSSLQRPLPLNLVSHLHTPLSAGGVPTNLRPSFNVMHHVQVPEPPPPSPDAPKIVIAPPQRLHTDDIITLRTDAGTYVKRYYPFPPPYHISGLLAYQDFVDPYSKLTVEVVAADKIRLKADNGNYLKRFCCWNRMSVIGIYLPNPDPFSTFTVERVPGTSGKIRLSADNGQYLKRYRGWNGHDVIVTSPEKDEFGIFDVGFVARSLKAGLKPYGVVVNGKGTRVYTGDVVTIKLDNEMFAKRYYPFPYTPYSGLLAYQTFVDAFSKFTVEVVDVSKGVIRLKADNKTYLKRFCCHAKMSVIAMYLKNADAFSDFTVIIDRASGKARLQAENGAYLKRFYGWQGMNFIAVLYVKDQYGLFDIDVVDSPVTAAADFGVVISEESAIKTGSVVTLKGEFNGLYLERFYPFPFQKFSTAMAFNPTISSLSKFVAEVSDDGKLSLKADNGMYLKRYCCWKGMSIVGIYQTFKDKWSFFTVTVVAPNVIGLQAENGQYVKLFAKEDGKNVVVVKGDLDWYATFIVEKL